MADKYLGENLIFIISQPRSGSTLLQRVLAGNDAVATSSEPWLMLHPVYGRRSTGIKADYSADWAAQGVNEFLDNYTDGQEVYDDGIRAFAKTIYENAMAKGGAQWFIDKTPRYLMIVEDLLRLFPAAKFVFLIRNPLSVLASIVNTQIQHDLYTLERFAEDLLLGPSTIINAIRQLGDRAIIVRYEEFVTAPEEHIQRVCKAIGIEYQMGMADYSDSEPVKGFMQDRTGIHQHERPSEARIESWRQLLTESQQIHFAQNYLRDLGRETIEAFGYSYDELNDAVRQAAERNKGSVLLHWRVALLHPDQLKGFDQQAVSSYRNIRDYGPIKGRILSVLGFFTGFMRQMKFVFGRTK